MRSLGPVLRARRSFHGYTTESGELGPEPRPGSLTLHSESYLLNCAGDSVVSVRGLSNKLAGEAFEGLKRVGVFAVNTCGFLCEELLVFSEEIG